jgi:hypothetical protein
MQSRFIRRDQRLLPGFDDPIAISVDYLRFLFLPPAPMTLTRQQREGVKFRRFHPNSTPLGVDFPQKAPGHPKNTTRCKAGGKIKAVMRNPFSLASFASAVYPSRGFYWQKG